MLRSALVALLLASASAFQAPRLPAVARRAARSPLSMADDEGLNAGLNEKFSFGGGNAKPSGGRLGSSVDQDGKSNVWAVEPKMEVEVGKEGDGFKKTAIIGGGAAAAIAAVAAIVANLPNPDLL
mmetsp:Transcript_16600/g.30057  ORF Transcript_16600/g.30057 Transcript_16600/m.30057 type:complete len:125 (-) Transcript_16600:96-470(-)|eukprot:CAMPEP_0205925348 /NCGR_PEP_ID=MMETSP1325-20131115/18037_1 /ASSEMBLY_ACC=CAM_ASM_000708 /TAXON_ID=236786 /ORGANISM="Florenciella sp., Strain RCC1007" /LENGTH=124 /DNA_ID=CAMNT_0053293863 /DNA_START=35 /DNA_END=409 /DNA_ORIENTATION=+